MAARRFVRDELKRLIVDALIIDNADHLDHFTVERLRQTREFLGQRFALIFYGRIEKSGMLNFTLANLLPKVFDTLEIEQPLELKRLKAKEVMGAVLLEIMADQKITFSSNLTPDTIGKMREQFYEDTGRLEVNRGTTATYAKLTRYSDGKVRHLRQEDWEQIMGKPLN